MKTFFNTLACIVFALGLPVIAQTDNTITTDAKTKFINNQGYLSSASSLQDFKSFYGDSLKGFDEASLKLSFLNNAIYGQEYMNCMNAAKRAYINTKYKIGSAAAKPATTGSPSPGHSSKPIGGNNTINTFPCNNEDFEATAVGPYNGAANATAISGWTMSSCSVLTSTCAVPVWTAGAFEASVVSTPYILPLTLGGLSNVPNSPLGGSKILRISDGVINNDGMETKISQTFPVVSSNALFQFAYAGAWQDGTHNCCTQAGLKIQMYDCTGAPLNCSSVTFSVPGTGCPSSATGYNLTGGVAWTSWQVKYIDLTPYIGTCVTIEIINTDCTAGGHFGVVFVDAKCGGQLACPTCTIPPQTATMVAGPVSFCAGGNQAIISAPLGYGTYQWVSPFTGTIPASQGGTAPTLTITSPVPNSVYTVNLVTPSGCPFFAIDTLKISSVNIAGLGTSPSCAGGASGSATVTGNGSGTGYNYMWLNSSGVTVGTASVATGLAPGVYSIGISGFGAAGCGTSVATVTIGIAAPSVIDVLKPFCGSAAYLAPPLPGGSGFHWYSGTGPITPISGNAGIAPGYTTATPCNNCVYWLSYLSPQGCQDSVKYTLVSSTPGILSIPAAGVVCPGASNGTANIVVVPPSGAPTGQNAFTVTGVSPGLSYTTSVGGLTSNTYIPTGMAAGVYSVEAFDGSCKYSNTFNITTLVFNFALSPPSATLCSGTYTTANVVFPFTPPTGQYTYSWSPNQFLAGNTQATSIISPTTAPGTINTIIYTVTATSTLASCQVSKTMSITVINPLTPTITPIPNMCNNGIPYTVSVTPSGGTFTMGTLVNGSFILNSSTGVITPANAPNGTSTFTYMYGVNICTVATTASFQVSQFNTAALTSTVPALCVTNPPFNLMNIVQSATSGSWTGTGVTGSAGNYSFNAASPTVLNTGNYVITYSTSSTPNPTVCPAFNTLTVAVTKTITPLITAVPEFCTNHAPITLTATPAGGTWAGTGISVAGVVTPTALSGANFTYTYTWPSGPCVNTNTITLNVSQFNSAALSGPVPYLCVSNAPFSLLSIMQATAGATWYGTGTSALPNYFTPTGLPTGIYTPTVICTSFPNPALCPDSRTVAVSVLNPPAPNITQPGARCSIGTPFHLSVSPATGSWVATQYLSADGLFTPSLGIIGNNMVQYIIGTNTCNTQQTKYVSVEAFVPAATTANQLPDKCTTSSIVDLSNFALSTTGVWSGPGVTGNSFNPNAAGQGNYVLTHNTASSPSGLCPDQATIAVNVYSLQPPVLSKVGPLCNSSAPRQIQTSPVGGLFGGDNNTAITSAGMFNPAWAIIGKNVISYSITSGPCVAFTKDSIFIEAFVPADMTSYPGSFCKNTPGKLELNQFAQYPGGEWIGHSVSNGAFVFANSNVGKNVVTYRTHSYPTATLCPDVKTLEINIENAPVINLRSSAVSGCAPFKVSFDPGNNDIGTGIPKWNFGDGGTISGSLHPEYTFNSPGTYTVMFDIPDGNCPTHEVLKQNIVIFESPVANFSMPEEVYISSTEVRFTNQSTVLGNNSYQWKIGGLYQVNEVNPTVIFPQTLGKYPITLIATTPNGCVSEVTKMLEVKNEFNIFIPSSFTPNFDNLNDEFMPKFSPYGLDEKTYDMEIFDRWGASLFKTKDISKGWDGSVQNKGIELLKPDVYVYKIKYKDLEGHVYNKVGHVTLLR